MGPKMLEIQRLRPFVFVSFGHSNGLFIFGTCRSYGVRFDKAGVITAHIRSVWEGNVFIRVCLPVCSTLGGGSHVTFP